MSRLAVLALVFTAVSCRCKPVINPTETGFRVQEMTLDFGRVLEGQTASQDVHVSSTSQSDQTLALAITGPFTIPNASVNLPGGSMITVPVTFNAADMPATGKLTVSGEDGGVDVILSGVGVIARDCLPTAPCRESTYDLPTDRCVETISADGANCTPTSTCLEGGQCRAGVCEGVARACNDANKCTVDGCAEGIGCVNSPITCPAPTAPCMIATCNPNAGCSQDFAPEGTPCGPIDCDAGFFCDGFGACLSLATPDNFPCSPPTPCQDIGHCVSHVCKRPDAGVMVPQLTLNVGGTPPSGRPMLLSFAGELFGEICSLPLPVPDAGLSDGRTLDAGARDGGLTGDGGTCALISYTNNGFERFTEKFADGRERALLHIALTGAAMLDDAGLELRSLANGAVLSRVELPGPVVPSGIASSSASEPWAVASVDGGTLLVRVIPDGGMQPLATLGQPLQLLGLDEAGGAVMSSPSAGTVAWVPSALDGGVTPAAAWAEPAPDAATATLATTNFFAGVHNRQLVRQDDAGIIATLDWTDDAGQPLRVLERFSLMSGLRTSAFYKLCPHPLMSCLPEQEELWLRSVSTVTGQIVEDARLAKNGADSAVVEAALLDLAGFPPGVLTLVQLHTDAGPNAWLRLALNGVSDLACPFPPGSDIAGATIGGGLLWAYVQRDGGPWALEAYPLSGVSPSFSGWPLADGISGQRRAR
jgi:hypothetical protein